MFAIVSPKAEWTAPSPTRDVNCSPVWGFVHTGRAGGSRRTTGIARDRQKETWIAILLVVVIDYGLIMNYNEVEKS